MSTEKIAFLFPFKEAGGGESIPSPLLAYDIEEFPADIDMSAGIFFIGLQHKTPYYLELQVLRSQGNDESPVSAKRGLWIRPSDTLGYEDDIAASIDIDLLKCRFDEPGSYFICASLLVDQKPIHSNRAYFKVSKAK